MASGLSALAVKVAPRPSASVPLSGNSKPPAKATVGKPTIVKIIAMRFIVAPAPGSRAASSSQVDHQDRNRRRRHSGDAAGLSDRARPHAAELLLDLARQAREPFVIDRRRQLELVERTQPRRLLRLARHVAFVLDANLDALGDARIVDTAEHRAQR